MAATSSVHQLQRSLLLGFAHSPCTTRPTSTSSPSPFSTAPSFWHVKRRVWRAPRIRDVSSEVHKSWLTCNRGNELRGFLDMARVWHPLTSTGIRSKISRVCGDCENNVNGFRRVSRSLMFSSSSTIHKDLTPTIGQGGAALPRKRELKWPLRASHVEPLTNGNGGIATENLELPWWTKPPDMCKQIFCNRSLNMKSIEAIGFDMDYTLAQYKADTFESLAYNGTVQKLVQDLNYPSELLQWKFDWRFMVRGLVLDKRRGCILKMDRHKYVKVAYHGFRELSREDRQATYGNTLSRESYDEPDYALIDTLFSLAEAYLFMQLVDFKDAFPEKIPSGTDYSQLYKDVRSAVDLCHRDGTLKQAVANEPKKYINEDPQIIPMLKMLRQSGRMTFLVTNSLWDYTHVVMNYLCGKCGTDGGVPRDEEWLSYFDVVITGSAKPTFFLDGNRAPLFEVDITTGMLQNTDAGTPMAQIGGVGIHTTSLPKRTMKQSCRVFQGGSVAHLHKLLSIEAGAQVLYVGDHIYGDILRSKKELGWRTMLVVPELGAELKILRETISTRKEISRLRNRRDALEDSLQRLEWCLRFERHSEAEQMILEQELLSLQRENFNVREQHRQAQRDCHHRFHKTWGQLMKTGYQNSRFSHQVERFACLYTSHVTNLCHYSPNKSYRTTEDSMPHELQGEELCSL